jgi:hypothetical protein
MSEPKGYLRRIVVILASRRAIGFIRKCCKEFPSWPAKNWAQACGPLILGHQIR